MKERALLVTVDFGGEDRPFAAREAAAELEELCASAGLDVVESLLYKQARPSAPLLVGSGKADEIALVAKRRKAAVVVFHQELSPSQQRNLEEIVPSKTIDRTQLILDIFAQRARSNEGKLQVELAQLKYLLPRLAGKGINLSRLGGGVGTRGPGEQKLEMDRRRIRERIAKLSRQLGELQERRLAAIEKKKERELPLVALVGYTNAGKSTLFNALTGAGTLVKNKLFSTLDTTTRAFTLPGERRALLVDTVGFIRDLPHHLVESFKATLEETVHADVLVHVVDAGRPDNAVLRDAVEGVLAELGVEGKSVVVVMNKADALGAREREAVMREDREGGPVAVSALTGDGLGRLLERVGKAVKPALEPRKFFVPKGRLKLASLLYDAARVTSRRDTSEGVWLEAEVSQRVERWFLKQLEGP